MHNKVYVKKEWGIKTQRKERKGAWWKTNMVRKAGEHMAKTGWQTKRGDRKKSKQIIDE